MRARGGVLAGTVMMSGGVSAARAQAGGPANLDTVLRQMDAASAKFRSAEADFKWDLYQRVIRETTTQTGTIYFVKHGG